MLLGSYGGANAESGRAISTCPRWWRDRDDPRRLDSALDMPRVDMRWFKDGTDAIMQAYSDIACAPCRGHLTDLNSQARCRWS